MLAAVESDREFRTRIEAEEKEARAVRCPLATCAAEPGKGCMTDAGELRIRHSRRLWLARKQAA
jgi:hypothetical protein